MSGGRCGEIWAGGQKGWHAGEIRLKLKLQRGRDATLFTVIVTVVGVKWNAAVNSSLSGPTFGVFRFYEAEEDICLHRWPLREFSRDLLIFHRDLWCEDAVICYFCLLSRQMLSWTLNTAISHPWGPWIVICDTAKEVKCSAGILFYCPKSTPLLRKPPQAPGLPRTPFAVNTQNS